MQMLLFAVLINAPHTALENREIAFRRVGVNLAAAILASAVINIFMLCDNASGTGFKEALEQIAR